MHLFMGGTFDPVHCGHLQGAREVCQLLDTDSIYLLPAKVPVHKTAPHTSTAARLAMLEIAIAPFPEIHLDLREVHSGADSYTLDTLKQLRAELGAQTPLIMVIGMDSFSTLPSWRGYRQFLSLCHIIVLQRPSYQLAESPEHHSLMQQRTESSDELKTSSAGKLLFYQQSPLNISASEIRQQLQKSLTPELLPSAVADYIKQHQLYKSMLAAT